MVFAFQLLTTHVIVALPLAGAAIAVTAYVWPSQFGLRLRLAWLAAIAVCGLRGLAYLFLGGDAQYPELPPWLIWTWDWAGNGLVFLAAFCLVWRFRPCRRVLLPLAAWGLSAVGLFNALKDPVVREAELTFDDLPANLDGYRILHLSDLHCSEAVGRWRTRRVVDRVNGLKPDLICFTGDVVDGRVARLADDVSPLRDLAARDGVIFIKGNHEYHIEYRPWESWFRKNGFVFLMNGCVFPRQNLVVGGVTDVRADKYGDPSPDVGRAFRAATNGEFRVLLEHRPTNARGNFSDQGVRLQLSGHTHGGVMPVVSLVAERKAGGFLRGVHRIGRGFLNVSAGLGVWPGFTARFFNPPEMTLITLRRGSEAFCP